MTAAAITTIVIFILALGVQALVRRGESVAEGLHQKRLRELRSHSPKIVADMHAILDGSERHARP